MKNNVQQRSRWDMASEQMKYAAVQAVAGGVTAVQGSPGSGTDAWDSMLSRISNYTTLDRMELAHVLFVVQQMMITQETI